MALVNTLTPKGRDILDQIERVEASLAETENGRMNECVTALAKAVKDMLMATSPFWEKESTT